ncbi:MAG: DUF2213 domain-containing protein [Clostridiales bacterium]|nr:DUF2213 domain-containing protein [Clostridiales bacterium]
MHYYGTRLSENISKRKPEGYLLCLNVPVARTGTQEYLPGELGLGGAGTVPVYRPEEEVFSPATVASFEGMPVTNDHPPEGVDVTNIRALQKGHAHNVRRGSGEESDLLLADLIITDPALITAILEDGKREISCGYTYELCEENGQYVQRQIRGNHVAVVDAGRAGSRVCIKDKQPPALQRGTRQLHPGPETERRKNNMKKSLSKVLARMAKDGDIETVAGIIEEMLEPENENNSEIAEPEEAAAETAPVIEEPAAVIETPETTVTVDESALGELISRLDRIISLLESAPAADEDPAEETAEAVEEVSEAAEAAGPAAGEIAAMMEEVLDPVASVVLEEEEEEEPSETLEAGDALRAALAAVRPALVKMPPKVRRQVAGDIAARIRRTEKRGTTGTDAYAALVSARKRTAPASAELGRRIMEKRNISYVKQ